MLGGPKILAHRNYLIQGWRQAFTTREVEETVWLLPRYSLAYSARLIFRLSTEAPGSIICTSSAILTASLEEGIPLNCDMSVISLTSGAVSARRYAADAYVVG